LHGEQAEGAVVAVAAGTYDGDEGSARFVPDVILDRTSEGQFR